MALVFWMKRKAYATTRTSFVQDETRWVEASIGDNEQLSCAVNPVVFTSSPPWFSKREEHNFLEVNSTASLSKSCSHESPIHHKSKWRRSEASIPRVAQSAKLSFMRGKASSISEVLLATNVLSLDGGCESQAKTMVESHNACTSISLCCGAALSDKNSRLSSKAPHSSRRYWIRCHLLEPLCYIIDDCGICLDGDIWKSMQFEVEQFLEQNFKLHYHWRQNTQRVKNACNIWQHLAFGVVRICCKANFVG